MFNDYISLWTAFLYTLPIFKLFYRSFFTLDVNPLLNVIFSLLGRKCFPSFLKSKVIAYCKTCTKWRVRVSSPSLQSHSPFILLFLPHRHTFFFFPLAFFLYRYRNIYMCCVFVQMCKYVWKHRFLMKVGSEY